MDAAEEYPKTTSFVEELVAKWRSEDHKRFYYGAGLPMTNLLDGKFGQNAAFFDESESDFQAAGFVLEQIRTREPHLSEEWLSDFEEEANSWSKDEFGSRVKQENLNDFIDHFGSSSD